MVTTSPFMKPEPSLIRKAARLANSSDVPKRFKGILSFENCSHSGRGRSRENAPSVGIGPGAIAFIRILRFPHSTAKQRVNVCTAAFEIADGTTYADPLFAYVVTTLSTTPGICVESHRLPQAKVVCKVPIRTI